jgi:hypothetical protein
VNLTMALVEAAGGPQHPSEDTARAHLPPGQGERGRRAGVVFSPPFSSAPSLQGARAGVEQQGFMSVEDGCLWRVGEGAPFAKTIFNFFKVATKPGLSSGPKMSP